MEYQSWRQLFRERIAVTVVVLSVACASSHLTHQVDGHWEGTIEFPGLKTRVHLVFTTTNQQLRGSMDIPRSRTIGLLLDDLELRGPNLFSKEHEEVRSLRFDLTLPRNRRLHFSGEVLRDSIQGKITGADVPGKFLLQRIRAQVENANSGPIDISWRHVQRDYWPTKEWKNADPAQLGIAANGLNRAERFILDERPEIRSLLIIRNGRLVYEKYFRNANADDAFNIKSVSKSCISALAGIALREGYLRDLDQTLPTFLPEYFASNADPRKRRVTLRHLLAMTAGFEWVENGPITRQWVRSPDYVKFTIDSKLDYEPGTVYTYNTALSHMLSVIMTRTSHISLLEFAKQHLFDPIGITIRQWDTDPQGFYFGGAEMYMTARDMARFGFLYLNQGQWEGRQIVPAEWVRESTQRQSAGEPFIASYGYFWWLAQHDDFAAFYALGYGGQLIYIVPALDLVIVMTSTTKDPANNVLQVVSEFILPTIVESC